MPSSLSGLSQEPRPSSEAGDKQTIRSSAEVRHPADQGRAYDRKGWTVPTIWIILRSIIYYTLDIGSMGVVLIW